jgi:hypothetical protein
MNACKVEGLVKSNCNGSDPPGAGQGGIYPPDIRMFPCTVGEEAGTQLELYATRLYTGPMFIKYNVALRGSSGMVPFLTKQFECVSNNQTRPTRLPRPRPSSIASLVLIHPVLVCPVLNPPLKRLSTSAGQRARAILTRRCCMVRACTHFRVRQASHTTSIVMCTRFFSAPSLSDPFCCWPFSCSDRSRYPKDEQDYDGGHVRQLESKCFRHTGTPFHASECTSSRQIEKPPSFPSYLVTLTSPLA